MREYIYFNDEIHKERKKIIESIILDADSMMNHHKKTITLSYDQINTEEGRRIHAASGLGWVAVQTAVRAIEGLHSISDPKWVGNIVPEKSNHRLLLKSNMATKERAAYCLTQLVARRKAQSQMMTMARGGGQFYKIYGVLLTHDGLYSTVNKTLPAEERPYETITSSLIRCGTDSMLNPLLNGKELNGLKVPRSFDLIKGSLSYHAKNMDVEKFLNNLLARYNNGLGRENMRLLSNQQSDEMTNEQLEELSKYIQ